MSEDREEIEEIDAVAEEPEKKRGFRAGRLILQILLILLLLLNLLVIVSKEKTARLQEAVLPWSIYPVVSGSMEPEIRTGDLILVTVPEFSEVTVGDNAVYCRDGELIVHKVIGRDSEYLITKGNANEQADAPVSQTEYRGVMKKKIPLLGGIWRIISKPVSLGIFTLLTVLLVYGDRIFGFIYRKLFEKEKNETEC